MVQIIFFVSSFLQVKKRSILAVKAVIPKHSSKFVPFGVKNKEATTADPLFTLLRRSLN